MGMGPTEATEGVLGGDSAGPDYVLNSAKPRPTHTFGGKGKGNKPWSQPLSCALPIHHLIKLHKAYAVATSHFKGTEVKGIYSKFPRQEKNQAKIYILDHMISHI